MVLLKYKGCSLFRQRVSSSLLSRHPLSITDIRTGDTSLEGSVLIGLQDFEANFLRLVEKIADGCHIEINETGTTLKFKPGILVGGKITHDCGKSRSIGWFIEGIIPLAMFCKTPLQLTLTGITNDALDISVDILRSVTLPLLQNFGIQGTSLVVKRRGAAPKGGGLVELSIPIARTSLLPIHIVQEGE
jgi:RNA 3'-terminal phosphate cyclase-like protein